LKRVKKKSDGKFATSLYELKEYKRLIEAVSFKDYPLNQELQNNLKFFKFLAKKPNLKQSSSQHQRKLRLWLPDTVVYNDVGSPAFWVYTGEDGWVHKTENFQEKHVVSKLGDQYHLDEVTAVMKTIDYDENGLEFTDIEILNSRDLAERAQASYGRGELWAIQKFIKWKGPQPFVVRSVWRKENPNYSWIITGKHKFQDPEIQREAEKFSWNPFNILSCSIIKWKTGRTVDETSQYLENLVKFLETNLRVFFDEMIADFIKDESGLWWMIGVKAYKFSNPSVKPNLKLFIDVYEEYEEIESKEEKKSKSLDKKIQVCRMWMLGYPIPLLSQRMTLKMIITTESQLKSLGIRRDWLDHGELANYDLHTLYESRRVCSQWFALYKQVRELNEVAIKFSRALGIPVDEKNDHYAETTGGKFHGVELQEQNEKQMRTTEQEAEVPRAKSPDIDQEAEALIKMKKLHRFKILFIAYDLIEFNVIPKNIDNYSLVYNFMNEKLKIKLSSKKTLKVGWPIIPINKLKLHYFFSNYREGLHKFISEEPQVIKLYCKNELISKVQLNINDFKSSSVNQKSYYLPMKSDNFNCYIRCMIGIEMDVADAINTSGIKLLSYKGIYLPPRDYMSCQPLIEEWEPRIPNIHKYNSELDALIEECKRNGNKMPVRFPLFYLQYHHQFSKEKVNLK
jgi:hypothetical protein